MMVRSIPQRAITTLIQIPPAFRAIFNLNLRPLDPCPFEAGRQFRCVNLSEVACFRSCLARSLELEGQIERPRCAGCGWALHFCNADLPTSPISLHDVESPFAFLPSTQLLVLNTPKMIAIGIIQMTIGVAKGQGNIQFYATKLVQATGNARINIGRRSRLLQNRSSLLVIAQFHHALDI